VTDPRPAGRLAVFDLDNTLVDRTAVFVRWAHDFVAAHDLPADAMAVLEAADGDGAVWREAFFADVKATLGLTEPVDVLVAAYRRDYVRYYSPDPRVTDAVARVRAAGWATAIVTNGPPTQVDKIALVGLADLFDAVVVSEVEGVRKPDPAIFELAGARTGVALVGGWMVGDHPENDVVGGHSAGLRTIWIDRGRTWDPALPAPDVVVADVPAAAAVILGTDGSPRPDGARP
jgi:putative hydrolase of the HAD superfamily